MLPSSCTLRLWHFLLLLSLLRWQPSNGVQTALTGHSAPDVDLLQALYSVHLNGDTKSSAVKLVEAPDGLPAFQLNGLANLAFPHVLYFPDMRLHTRVALMATFTSHSPEGGYLFAVVNPLDTVVQLGLRIHPETETATEPAAGNGLAHAAPRQNVTLYWTDSGRQLQVSSQVLLDMDIPTTFQHWTRLAIASFGSSLNVYLNCHLHASFALSHRAPPLLFDPASTLYIGQAGPLLLGTFKGVIQELRITGDPRDAARMCEMEGNTATLLGKERGDSMAPSGPAGALQPDGEGDGEGDVDGDAEKKEGGEETEGEEAASAPPAITPPPPFHPTVSVDYMMQRHSTDGEGLPATERHSGLPEQARAGGSASPATDAREAQPAGADGACAAASCYSDEELERKFLLWMHKYKSSMGDAGACRVEPAGQPSAPGESAAKGTASDSANCMQGAPGAKGDMGLSGFPGHPGRRGERGAKGDPGQIVYVSATGTLAGLRNASDPTAATAASPPGLFPYGPLPPAPHIHAADGDWTGRGPLAHWPLEGGLGAVQARQKYYGIRIIRSREDLRGLSYSSKLASLVYVMQDDQLFLRSISGWRPLVLGAPVQLADMATNKPPRKFHAVSTSQPLTGKGTASRTGKQGQANHQESAAAPALLAPAAGAHAPAEAVWRIEKPASKYRLLLVALNEPHAGNQGGIKGADFACFKESRKAGLRGTFRALLTGLTQDLDGIVDPRDAHAVPLVNMRGQPLAASFNALFGAGSHYQQSSDGQATFSHGNLTQASLYSFDGRDVLTDPKWPTKAVWHGSDEGGKRVENEQCQDWSSESALRTGRAAFLTAPERAFQGGLGGRRSAWRGVDVPLPADEGFSEAAGQLEGGDGWAGRLTGQSSVPCNLRLVVLCVQIRAL